MRKIFQVALFGIVLLSAACEEDEKCKVYKPGEAHFGICDEVLGWVWSGNECYQISGCGAENAEDMFDSEKECEEACE